MDGSDLLLRVDQFSFLFPQGKRRIFFRKRKMLLPTPCLGRPPSPTTSSSLLLFASECRMSLCGSRGSRSLVLPSRTLSVAPEASLGADRYLSFLTTINGIEDSGNLQVNVRHISKFLGTFRQYPLCVGSFSDKKCVYTPILSSYASRNPEKDVRRRMIFSTNASKNAAAESGSSESAAAETATTSDQFLSSSTDQPQVNGKEEAPSEKPKPVLNKAPLTAREKLRAARVLSKYTESKPSKPAMGSRILDALREADKGKKRPGLPEAPTNLFDDSNRGLQKEVWKFQLPGGNDLFIIAFSFVFITTVMLATTYIVWKAGAIHFNEL